MIGGLHGPWLLAAAVVLVVLAVRRGPRPSPTFALAHPNATYLDIGVDGLGYVYVLAYVESGASVSNYRLDIYTPNGDFLTRTAGVSAARLTVDTFRSVYTLNFESLAGTPRVEPSLSHWVPITPMT